MKTIDIVQQALHEDIQTGDITSRLLCPPSNTVRATVISKSHGIFFGMPIIEAIRAHYSSVTIDPCRMDGATVSPGDACCHLNGSGQDIVTLERTLLNFLQRLSGVATMTHQFVRALDDPSIHILDTRKTTPLLRHLEKQAVVAGGGHNHRQGLYDMILVKENHLISYINIHGIAAFNHQLTTHKNTHPNILIEVEVAEISLLSELDLTPIDIIMFDNMPLTKLTHGLRIIQDSRATVLTEVSGNIDLDTIHQYRGVPIDRMSIGRLTHSVNALDLSLLVQ